VDKDVEPAGAFDEAAIAASADSWESTSSSTVRRSASCSADQAAASAAAGALRPATSRMLA
jgi:hypothetical protein